MSKLFNLARMTVASTGTGNITLSGPATISGVLYLSFVQAGVSSGTVSYAIADTNPAGSEIGTATYDGAVTLTGRTPNASTNGGLAINMSTSAQVFITPRSQDIANLGEPNTFVNTITITPPSSKSGFIATMTPSGTTTGHQYANLITVNDAADTGDTLAGQGILHTLGSSLVTGFRYGLQTSLTLNTATKASSLGNFAQPTYAGIIGGFSPQANDTGSSTAQRTTGMGINAYVVGTSTAATYYDALIALSADISTPVNSTPRYRAGINIMEEGSRAQGSSFDTALGISGIAGGQVGFKNAILIGPLLNAGTQPLSSDATILATVSSANVAKGIDWSSFTFSGNQITGVGWTVNNSGYLETTAGFGVKDGIGNEVFINLGAPSASFNLNLPTAQSTAIGLPLVSGTATVFGSTAMRFASINTNDMFSLSMTSFASLAAGQTRFAGPACGDAAEANVLFTVPVAMTFKNMNARVATAPGGPSQSFAFTLRKNGADQTLTCTISSAATTGTDLVNTVTFAAGDSAALKIIASSSAATTVNAQASFQVITTSP